MDSTLQLYILLTAVTTIILSGELKVIEYSHWEKNSSRLTDSTLRVRSMWCIAQNEPRASKPRGLFHRGRYKATQISSSAFLTAICARTGDCFPQNWNGYDCGCFEDITWSSNLDLVWSLGGFRLHQRMWSHYSSNTSIFILTWKEKSYFFKGNI